MTAAAAEADERPFSDVLEDIGADGTGKLRLEEVVDAFGERGFGALILMLSLLSLFPWPPGSKAVFSVPIIILSLELISQREEVWLPRWALGMSIGRDVYRKALKPFLKPIRFVERLARPRLSALTGPTADALVGLVCIGLALMLALPVPFGDMLPGVTLMFLGLGVMQRDGAAILIGVVGSIICAVYLFLIWSAVTAAVGAGIDWIDGLF